MSQSHIDPAGLQRDVRISRHVREPVTAASVFGAILGGLVVLMALHQPASAQAARDHDTVESVVVPYGPGDLTDPVRRQRLLARIDRAALKACGAMDGLSIPMQDAIERSDCHHDSFAQGVAALHRPALTQMAATTSPPVGPTSQEP